MKGSKCARNAQCNRMPIRDLKGQIARLPEQPGVYLYYNGQGDTLYVGKARVLRDRVRSYLGAHGMSPRIDALLDEAQRLEVIVTDSVVEALALENNLIKQRAPKYNILLRDDKTYPYLQLTTGEAFPRVLVARQRRAGRALLRRAVHARVAGAPDDVADAQAVRHPVVQRGDHRGARRGPASSTTSSAASRRASASSAREDEYRVAVEHTQLFLEGRNDELLVTLRERMTEAAAAERFEQAAQLRDAHPHDRDAAHAPAEDGRPGARRSRRVRAEGRPRRRRRPGVPDAAAGKRRRADRAGDRRESRMPVRPAAQRGEPAEAVRPGTACAGSVSAGLTSATCCRRRSSSSTPSVPPPPEVHIPMPLGGCRQRMSSRAG